MRPGGFRRCPGKRVTIVGIRLRTPATAPPSRFGPGQLLSGSQGEKTVGVSRMSTCGQSRHAAFTSGDATIRAARRLKALLATGPGWLPPPPGLFLNSVRAQRRRFAPPLRFAPPPPRCAHLPGVRGVGLAASEIGWRTTHGFERESGSRDPLCRSRLSTLFPGSWAACRGSAWSRRPIREDARYSDKVVLRKSMSRYAKVVVVGANATSDDAKEPPKCPISHDANNCTSC